MKKIILCLILVFMCVSIGSCTIVDDGSDKEQVIKMIMPTGTPALGIAEYAVNAKAQGKAEVEVVAGSDPLIAAFSSKSHDIIVAPVNLGAKMYQTYGDYILYKTFVWGNLYVASKGSLTSLEDLNNKTVVVFGQNSTPDIVFKAILKNNPTLNITIEYATDVSEANTLLVGGKAEIIISAEPSLSNLKKKFNLSVIDLQEVWQDMTGNASYPQAGIFVKKNQVGQKEIKDALAAMKTSIANAISNPEQCATAAVDLHPSFATLGKEVLISAIPHCHYQILENDKEAVNYYLQMMIDLGFGKQMGEKLPDDDFYY